MTYRLLMMDIDSTLINEEGIDLLAEYAGVGQQVKEMTSSAMSGGVDFATSLRERVQLLAGQPVSLLDRVRDKLTLTPGAENLVTSLRSQGWRIGVVSGGFHEIMDEFLAPLELDMVRANHFEISDGYLTGKVLEPVIGPREKAEALQDLARRFEISLQESVAMGDGANDREMLELAGLSIAFCAKPALQKIATHRIDQRDLSLVLDIVARKHSTDLN